MKNQFFGVFFYMLYLVAMMRPVMPFLDYMVNYDYIAEVLCENRDKPYLECNGKCYLEKQLNEAGHDSHDHNSPVPKIELEDYPVSLVLIQDEKSTEQLELIQDIHSYQNFAIQEYINTLDRPPGIHV